MFKSPWFWLGGVLISVVLFAIDFFVSVSREPRPIALVVEAIVCGMFIAMFLWRISKEVE